MGHWGRQVDESGRVGKTRVIPKTLVEVRIAFSPQWHLP